METVYSLIGKKLSWNSSNDLVPTPPNQVLTLRGSLLLGAESKSKQAYVLTPRLPIL